MDSDADKTRMIRRARPSQEQADQAPQQGQDAPVDPDATRIIQPGEMPPTIPSGAGDDATRLLNQVEQTESSLADSDKTQLVRRSSAGKSAPVSSAVSSGPGTSIDDPVTGWLVVVDGPGKGKQVAIGEQDNHVGRGGGADGPRVIVDFGDQGISRNNAFMLRYDPKKRRFKILPGEGTNIVYINDADLDSPMELSAGDVIEVSETKLRFVPFCGAGFDWADTENGE